MRIFRTRSTVVQALQVTGFNDDDMREWVGPGRYRRVRPQRRARMNVEPDGVVAQVYNAHLGAWLDCRVGDWVERGAHGEFLPVRPDHARARYQPAFG